MYEPSRGRSGGRVALVAVLLLVAAGLGAGASYYVLGGPEAAAAANTVTSTLTLPSIRAALPSGVYTALTIFMGIGIDVRVAGTSCPEAAIELRINTATASNPNLTAQMLQ